MPEPPLTTPPPCGTAPQLQALRAEGAQQLDPVRFRYLEVLAQRAQAASGTVHNLLQDKLRRALAVYVERWQQQALTPAQATPPGAAQPQASAGPLAPLPLRQLNHMLQAHWLQAATPDTQGALPRLLPDAPAQPEMKSLQRFRESWARLAAQEQVDRALGRGPDNPGPLNSHMLVLRALALMRDLSPDYLNRFLAHADTLLWLELAQAPGKRAAAPAKSTRKGRGKVA